MIIMKMEGLEDALERIRKVGIKYESVVEEALYKGGLKLQRESQKIVPVQYSHLKRSAYTRSTLRGWHTVVWVGYTATYAIYVHEITTNRHKPGKTAKFLEIPMKSNRADILRVIRDYIATKV